MDQKTFFRSYALGTAVVLVALAAFGQGQPTQVKETATNKNVIGNPDFYSETTAFTFQNLRIQE